MANDVNNGPLPTKFHFCSQDKPFESCIVLVVVVLVVATSTIVQITVGLNKIFLKCLCEQKMDENEKM